MTPEEIAGKIEWEGGLEAAFIDYGLKTGNLAIDKAADDFRTAYRHLEAVLNIHGVEFDG